ncbi:MAG: SEL1-like repeat protein [Oscillospiraceae bacterium]|nr:SEL1-like repeat protein [Oscillospiraceae bacterium]
MKKITALLIAIALVLSLCACGSTAPGNQTASEEASVTPEPTEKPETELEKLIREAEEGVPDAMLGLGEKYLYGSDDVGQDTGKGLELLTKAAGTGNVAAMKDLGYYYLYSKDGKEPEKGLEWLTKAADAGDADAMYSLYGLYGFSDIIPRDPEKSAEYSLKAAALGHKFSMMNAYNMYKYEGALSEEEFEALTEKYNEATADEDFSLNEFDLSFKTTDLDGNTVDESVFSGKKLTMLYFWSTEGRSSSDLKSIQALSEKYADRGFQVIGVVNDLGWNAESGTCLIPSEDIVKTLDDNNAGFLNIRRYRVVGEDETANPGRIFMQIGNDHVSENFSCFETGSDPTAVFVDGDGNLIRYPDTYASAMSVLSSVSDRVEASHTDLSQFLFVYDSEKLFYGIKNLAEVVVTGAKGSGWDPIVGNLLDGGQTWTEEQIAEWKAMEYREE